MIRKKSAFFLKSLSITNQFKTLLQNFIITILEEAWLQLLKTNLFLNDMSL